MNMDKIAKLREMIEKSNRIVFFGGAGVTTESNIPDFRSADGLYQEKYHYPPEQVVSHTFFEQKPELFYDFYKNKPLRMFSLFFHKSNLLRVFQDKPQGFSQAHLHKLCSDIF